MKAQTLFSKQNIQWLGIFLVFLALLSFIFMILSSRRTQRIVSSRKPLVVHEIDLDDGSTEENLFESLDFQNVHNTFQASYLEMIRKIASKETKNKDGSISITVDVKRDSLLFLTYKTAQENYEKVLKKIEDHEKNYKIRCFARMKKLILAVLYSDKKLGKRTTKFDVEKLIEIGALDAPPVCPRDGEYSIIYKNGRRLFNCSVHGILKN